MIGQMPNHCVIEFIKLAGIKYHISPGKHLDLGHESNFLFIDVNMLYFHLSI